MHRAIRDRLGVCEWIHFQDYGGLENTLAYLGELRVRHLRTGISWADWHRVGGRAWSRHVIRTFVRHGFDVLPCLWHTPPSISRTGACNGPPHELGDFARFVEEVCIELGDCFTHLELWNEPNNWLKWDNRVDPEWELFAAMFSEAADCARRDFGKQVVLGGMSPIDHRWIENLERRGVLECVDVLAAHAFPGQWNEPDDRWGDWTETITYLRSMARGREVWITETGRASWDPVGTPDEMYIEQRRRLRTCAGTCAADRVYWYALTDLPDYRDEIEWTIARYHEPRERHMGLVTAEGARKPSFFELQQVLADG